MNWWRKMSPRGRMWLDFWCGIVSVVFLWLGAGFFIALLRFPIKRHDWVSLSFGLGEAIAMAGAGWLMLHVSLYQLHQRRNSEEQR